MLRGAWLVQPVEDLTLDLKVVSSSPILDCGTYLKKEGGAWVT